MRFLRTAAIAQFLLGSIAFAQSMQMPQPAPELKKLDYFAGNWKTDADIKPGPFGAGGKMSSMDRVEWMQGSFFLLINTTFKGGMGSGVELAIMGYDPTRKVYTYTSFNSSGEHESATGTLDGDTWTWTSDPSTTPNQPKWRFTQKVLSPSSYGMKFEMAMDGTTWAPMMQGTATKQ